MEKNCLSCTQCCKGQNDDETSKGKIYCIAKEGYTDIQSCNQYINRFGRKFGLEFLWMRPDGAGYQLNINDWVNK